MPDEVTYPAPIEQRVYAGTTKLEPKVLTLDLEEGVILCKFVGDNGVTLFAEWRDDRGENATGLIMALNTANLSTNTLRKRLLTQAVNDGKIPAGGTIS